jgi:superfamily II DNA or RNA helicase
MLVELRDYQLNAVEKIRSAYRTGFRAPLLVLATGSGKTVIFCHITESAAARGKRIYILVHRAELLRQTSRHLARLGVDHGIIAPGVRMGSDLVQVASVQTLARRLDRFEIQAPDVLVIDEAHHANASTWRSIINRWPAARLLGVTATPCRLDGSGLGVSSGGFFDTMVQGVSVRALIDRGFLSEPIVYSPPSGVDLEGVATRAGDFAADELNRRLDRPSITGCAVSHYLKICRGTPAIAFCCSVDHAVHVATQFNAAGIPATHLSGAMGAAEREERIEGLGSGRYMVLTSCDVVSEGTDIPIVGAAICLRPSKSRGLVLQQWGRALRPFPGKKNAIILDHAGNAVRHGMLPDTEQIWNLDAKRRKRGQESIAPVQRCGECFAVFAASVLFCPECGFPVPQEKKAREIEKVDGELVLLDSAGLAESVEMRRARFKNEERQSTTLADFQSLAKERGYSAGWAWTKFNIIQRYRNQKVA